MNVDPLLAELSPQGLRRLKRDLSRDLVRITDRLSYLEIRDRERRETAAMMAALPGASRVQANADRLARDLAIMRAAWRGRSNRDLARRYELAPATISRIISRRRRDQAEAES